ncbi:MAG: UDP-N-acetylglucosamine 1-carboxyvinyltransferase [Alphaproteobacteria bacterium]|nr:UDP-N-acetylglucosamine 1-carboxyvinyltransferase [Alphaproteobacteria bacterium]
MDLIRIRGGRPLKGRVSVSGAKNAALPLMAASLLTDEVLTLSNLPHLVDISTMARLLGQLGAEISMNGEAPEGGNMGRVLSLQAATITNTTAPYDLVRRMRASVLVLGPLLARAGRARVSLPGGCAIGPRPVDLHLQGLAQLGATIELSEGYIEAEAPQGLRGARIVLPFASVGATENLLMAACLAPGETVLENAAREPEIADLAKCLIAMGARIEGIETGTLRIDGVDRLHGASHSVIADRIETGTHLMAAAITDGDLEIANARLDLVGAVADILGQAGVDIRQNGAGLRVRRRNGLLAGVDVKTAPYPGFPTDLQAQFMALMTVAGGASKITEAIFENRFMHVPELTRMGADIATDGSAAVIRGVQALTGAPVMATDLRASVSLVLAGLAAEGETRVRRVYHLDRGYERLVEKLAACGADIERVKDAE